MDTLQENYNNIELSNDLNSKQQNLSFLCKKIGFVVYEPTFFNIHVDPSIDFFEEISIEDIKHHFENNLYPREDMSNIERTNHVNDVVEKYVRPVLVEYYNNITKY